MYWAKDWGTAPLYLGKHGSLYFSVELSFERCELGFEHDRGERSGSRALGFRRGGIAAADQADNKGRRACEAARTLRGGHFRGMPRRALRRLS